MESAASKSGQPLVLRPVILSDFAIDLFSDAFKLDHNLAGRNLEKQPLVNVELIRNQAEFSLLAKACPAYDPKLQDECSSVVICKSDAQKLGIFHGSILKLKPFESDGKDPVKKSKQAIALVTESNLFSSTATDDMVTIRMLPVLWFNVCRLAFDSFLGLNSLKLRQCYLSRIQGVCDAGRSSSFVTTSYASEVVISCINSPQYSATASHDFLLKNYFGKSRLLQEGDVFGIHSAVDPQYFEPIPDGSDVRRPVVFFLVKLVRTLEKQRSSDACFVHRQCSQLLQESAVHGNVPVDMLSYYTAPTVLKRDLSPVFSEYISSLLTTFQPFMMNRRIEGLYPIVLLSGPTGVGLGMLTKLIASKLNMHHYKLNCSHLVADTAAATEAKLNQSLQIIGAYSPCVLHLDGIEALAKDRDGHDDSRVASYFVTAVKQLVDDCTDLPLLVIATTSSAGQVSNDIHQSFLHCVNVEVPNEQKRLKLLEILLADDRLSSDLSLARVAQRSAGMVFGDFVLLQSYVRRFAGRRLKAQNLAAVDHSQQQEAELNSDDFESALNQMQSMHSESIGAPKIPSVKWEDVGGLANVKGDILDTIQLPLRHPELLSLGLRRSGILLYGPPGTGKTLLAKAVATECSLNFLSVKGPELLNMYVGQSEENIRQVFERARAATPCVIFFDELDSMAPNRGRSGDSGGVMDRVVSQLLAELDGLHKSNSVFVIGATNRPDLVDPALLRPGRFDKLVYVGVSEDRESQLKILKALTRKFRLNADCKLENVIERCPLTMTGADFYALSADAMLNAIRLKIEALEAGSSEGKDSDEIEVSESDFQAALDRLVPSLSEADLHRYRMLQKQFANQSKTIG